MRAAAYFARQSYVIEQDYDIMSLSITQVGLTDERYVAHPAYVVGAVFSAVASVEAAIRELFADVIEGEPRPLLDQAARDAYTVAWPYVERQPTLEKYKAALQLARRPVQNMGGGTPYENVKMLYVLRGLLTHHTPTTVVVYSTHESIPVSDPKKLEQQLREKGIPRNQIMGGPFPHSYLSHGCAAWAVTSCVSFITEFFTLMDLPTPLGGAGGVPANLATEAH